MTCRWQELLSILPPWMRERVNYIGRETLQELRLRVEAPPELVLSGQSRWLDRLITMEDIQFCINAASRYSPWAADSQSLGYLTASGGHRIGLCGQMISKDGKVTGFRSLSSICIRIARDFPGISSGICGEGRSVLILGAPGWGKTTLLRDLARVLSQKHSVSVIDSREELFPSGFQRGKRMDVLSACPKDTGIEMALRVMGPEIIAVDEITAGEDCAALRQAAGCGVKLLATAHAGSVEEFRRRPIYRPLWEAGIFDTCIVLLKDKSFREERMPV